MIEDLDIAAMESKNGNSVLINNSPAKMPGTLIWEQER